MNSNGSRGKPMDYWSGQNHDGGGLVGRRIICSDSWVWPPPPKVKNQEGSCSCVSTIQKQQHLFNPNISLITSDQSVNPIDVSSLPDGKNPRPLRFLFSKELTHSDIKKRNKIILHRRDVEMHFPAIESSLGTRLYMEDKDTQETWCFRFRFRVTNNSKVHSIEGTRRFLQVHDLKAGDSIFIYKDDARRKYMIGASRRAKVSNGVSSVTNDDSLVHNKDTSPSSHIYLNKLSEYSMVDEMEEAATPQSLYPYGDATWIDDDFVTSCQLEKLAPLDTFKFFDLPLDYIFMM